MAAGAAILAGGFLLPVNAKSRAPRLSSES